VHRRPHRLADLVDLERLQHMCDGLSAASGIGLAVLDLDGTVLVASGWQDICTEFHRLHDETLTGCLKSDLQINRRIAEAGEAPGHYAYKCANGLWDVAFPLVIEGVHLAIVFTGQFFYDDDVIDLPSFRERARRLGFDEAAYMDALARVPVFSHERVARTIDFLGDFVGVLADLGLSALGRQSEHDALEESEERYRQLFESGSDAVFLIDNETGRILEANSAAAEMYGYTRDELLALTNEDLSAEPEKTQAVTHGTPVMADNVVTIPLRIHRRSDGSDFPVEITGRFFVSQGRAVHLAAIRDISARVDIEEALRLSEDKFAKAFHAGPDAILITRVSDGLVTDVNDGFVRLSGFTRDESVGDSTIPLGLWADPRDRDRCVAALQSQGSVRDLEFDFRARAGDILRCVYSGAIIAVDGEPHVLSVVRDVTERKRAEQEVLRLNAELERRVLERTAELEDANRELESFAYSVSHDLRQPLRALDGFSQILLDDYGTRLDDEGRSLLERIRAADVRMTALIDGLLELSRLNRGELSRERLDLSEMAHHAAERLAEAEPGRSVDLAIADGLVAHADRRLVRALLANLLGNAWKFTAKHETAHIEVGADDVDGERAFYVRDDGAGFDMAYADALFGAFQRLHSTGEFDGLGIGLATVQRIVRRHGGRVWAEGEVEKGATFHFTLPAGAGT
jgi:PAS domain S-box-containing protein